MNDIFDKIDIIVMSYSLYIMIIALLGMLSMLLFALIAICIVTIERFLFATDYSGYIIVLGPFVGILGGIYVVWRNYEKLKEGIENNRSGALTWLILLILKKGISLIRKPKHL